MKIYLSNGTFIEMPGSTSKVHKQVSHWFGSALDGDVLVLNLLDAGKVVRVQRRHVVQIDIPL